MNSLDIYKEFYLKQKHSIKKIIRWLICCLSSIMISHRIIYAENDFDDYFLLKTAFERVRNDIDLIHVDDGWELLEYLQKISLSSLYPSLIILDINMNGVGGEETLKLLKATKRYSHIPITMFTSSKNELKRNFYKEQGIEMISKPSSFDELIKNAKYFVEQCDRTINVDIN
jgi:DNA-binding response OmpR family regulator